LVFYKSFFAPITHDEAFSYGVYVPKSIKAILSFKEDVSANNHIINTLFMKLMSGIGFEQVGMLRLLSASSYLVLLFSLFFLIYKENNRYASLLYLIVCCNPYLLDFFAMARGYGVSFGLMVLSLYLFLKEENKNSQFWSMQIATIAMLANFNLVYFWLSIGLLHFSKFMSKKNFEKTILIRQFGTYLFPMLSLLYLLIVFKRLTAAQQLYFGGHNGIVNDLINDQLWCYIYDNDYKENPLYLLIWQWLPVMMLALAIILAMFKDIRKNKFYISWISVLFILIFSFLLIEINHRLTGSLYPLKRTGLFMSILLSCSVMLMLRFFAELKYVQIPSLIASYSIIGLLYFHTVSSYDSNRYREVPYDSHHHEILAKLKSEIKDENVPIDLSANWQVGPSLNFYKKTKHLNWLPEIKRDSIRTNAQYLLVFEEDFPNINRDSLNELLAYPKEGLYLFKSIHK
jgi:hypothetical protein